MKNLLNTPKKRILLAIFLFLLTLILSATIILQSHAFKSYLIKRADRYLHSHYGLSVSAESINYSLPRLAVTLEKVQVKASPAAKFPLKLFSAQRVHINLSYAILFTRKIHIQQLKISQPQIVLNPIMSKSASSSHSEEARNTGRKKPFMFRIDDFSLDNGSIVFKNKSYPIQVSLLDIIAHIQYFEKERIHKGFVQSQKGEIQLSKTSLNLKELLLEFNFDSKSIHIDKFLVDSELLSVEASGWIKDYQISPRYLLEIRSSFHLEPLQPLLGLDNRSAGTLITSGAIQGEGGEASITGKITGQDALFLDIPLKYFEAIFEGNRKGIAVSNLNLNIAQGTVHGTLLIPFLPKGEASFGLDWDSVSLETLEKSFLHFPFLFSTKTSGKISAYWQGLDFKNTETEGEIAFNSKGMASFRKKKIRLDGQIKFKSSKGIVRIYPSELALDNTRLSFSGSLDKTKMVRAELKLRADDLSEIENLITPPFHLAGRLSLSGNVDGTFLEPQVTLSLTGEEIAFSEAQISLLQSSLAYRQKRVDVSELLIQFTHGRVEGKGSVSYDLQRNKLGKRAELTLTAKELDIAPLIALLPVEQAVQGLFSGEVRLSGNLFDPQAEFKAAISELHVKRENFSRLEFEGLYRKKYLQLTRLSVYKGEGALEGTLGLDVVGRSYSVNLTGKSLELADFKSLNPGKDAISGKLNFSLEGRGTLEKPQFTFRLSMEKPRVFYKEWESIKLEVNSDGTNLKSLLYIPEGQATLEANLLLQEPYIFQGSLKTTSLDALNLLRPGANELPPQLSSEISALASFSFPLKKWKDAIMLIKMEKAVFSYRGLTIQNEAPLILSLENKEIIIRDFKLSGPNTEFSISGRLPLDEKRKGRIDVDGTIQLELLEPILPGFQISGLLALQGGIIGSTARPTISARIELKEGELASSDFPYSLHDLVMLAKIEENTVSLEKFSIGVDEGNISARGRFNLSSLFPNLSQLTATAKGPEENEIKVILAGLDLGHLARLAPHGFAYEFGGLVEGSIHLRGVFTDLNLLEIDGELSRLLVSVSQLRLENERGIKFSLKDRTFQLEELRLSGGNSQIRAAAKIDLEREPQLDARLLANLDSAFLAQFLKNLIVGGRVFLDLNLKGPVAEPLITGTGEIRDGFFQSQAYPILATNVNGSLQFSESNITLTSLQGIINGGNFNIKGRLDYRAFKVESAQAEITAERIQVNYPEGLQAQLNGKLSLEGKGNQWLLSGDMKINQAYYSTNIYPGAELINNIRFHRAGLKTKISPLLQKLNLDVGISTLDSLVIDNNLANLELDANIRVLGNVAEPRVSGRVANRYAGEITFADRSFEIEQARIDFLGGDPLEGQLNVTAHTNLTHKYDELEITLILTGQIASPNISLSSFPPRSQGELASLLITGYGTEKLRSDTANIIGNQLILYFASPLASPVTDRIKNLLKAEEVSIAPINIATEEDPGARFTFRKGLIKNVDIVYSIDVSNTQQQTWVLDYNLSRNFSIHSFRKDDGSYGSSLSHRFSLSSPVSHLQVPSETQTRRFIIKELRFEGNLVFPRQALVKKTHLLKRGAIFNYGDLRKSVENLIAIHKENKYLNATVTPAINYEANTYAIITLNIDPQRPASIVYSGDSISQKLKDEVVNSWNGRLPEDMAIAEARNRIISDLKSKGFYEAEVEVKKNIQEEQSIYAFSVKLGSQYRIQKFSLSDKSFIGPDTIRKEISKIPQTKGKGLWILFFDFKRARTRIKDLYMDQGFLNSEVGFPQITVDRKQRTIGIVLPLKEGPQSRIATIEIKGNHTFAAEELKKGLSLKEKSIYRPFLLSEDTNYLLNLFRSKGYQDVNVDLEIVPKPESPDFDLVYTIDEGEVHTIGEIEISGNRRTSAQFIRKELLLKEDDPVDMKTLILSQKKLYDLSIFKTVNIRRQALEARRNQEKILVEVQEDPRFAVSYGLRYNSEVKFEGFGQLDFINVFGRGRKGLVYYRENERQKDFRFSLMEPYLFGQRFNTLHSFYYSTETKATFKTEEMGYTIRQEIQLPFDFSLSYLYRFNRIHTYELEPVGPFVFDFTLFLSELQTYIVRDTRINKLNAQQGSFFSLSFTYSPEFLGTDLTYISIFCQYSLYKALGSKLVWASNYRVGLANAFDQVLIPSKRFYAGGGNSIRGFKRDMVGPFDPFLQQPEGGEVLFVMNQELRFPIYKWLEGVSFYDAGNVYLNFGDFNPFDVRQSFGFGLRLDTPAVLIRMDYGINLSPRPGEPRGVFFFSIGQAF